MAANILQNISVPLHLYTYQKLQSPVYKRPQTKLSKIRLFKLFMLMLLGVLIIGAAVPVDPESPTSLVTKNVKQDELTNFSEELNYLTTYNNTPPSSRPHIPNLFLLPSQQL